MDRQQIIARISIGVVEEFQTRGEPKGKVDAGQQDDKADRAISPQFTARMARTMGTAHRCMELARDGWDATRRLGVYHMFGVRVRALLEHLQHATSPQLGAFVTSTSTTISSCVVGLTRR